MNKNINIVSFYNNWSFDHINDEYIFELFNKKDISLYTYLLYIIFINDINKNVYIDVNTNKCYVFSIDKFIEKNIKSVIYDIMKKLKNILLLLNNNIEYYTTINTIYNNYIQYYSYNIMIENDIKNIIIK